MHMFQIFVVQSEALLKAHLHLYTVHPHLLLLQENLAYTEASHFYPTADSILLWESIFLSHHNSRHLFFILSHRPV